MSLVNRKNIRRVLSQSDLTDIDEGRVAYFRYKEVCSNLAELYGYGLPETVAVFAALSPNNDYYGNLRSAATVLKYHKDGVEPERVKISTYYHCRDRAYSYLSGVDFLETVKGKKIRAFYQNILNPLDSQPVTIDGHAFNIWRNLKTNLKDVAARSELNKAYDEVADDYRRVAAQAGLIPNQIQAITWFTWKRLHNIIYVSPQLELFRDATRDLWHTLRDVSQIKPYPLLSAASDIYLLYE